MAVAVLLPVLAIGGGATFFIHTFIAPIAAFRVAEQPALTSSEPLLQAAVAANAPAMISDLRTIPATGLQGFTNPPANAYASAESNSRSIGSNDALAEPVPVPLPRPRVVSAPAKDRAPPPRRRAAAAEQD
jgi:hypothetical protein